MDKTTAMTGATAAPRPGSGDPRAALAAEAGRLKAKVDRLVAVATRPTTDRSTSGQAQVSKLLALDGNTAIGRAGTSAAPAEASRCAYGRTKLQTPATR